MTKAEVNLLNKYIKMCKKMKTFPKNYKNIKNDNIEYKEKERPLD